ncbi:hypothetical protein E4N62_09505 [Streptomyces sp. MNU76]|uniref:hypothetical protein n=1 Tax=Streptomyces sp. MNU76 TaxID=2560026 RepID=UPI001E61E22A|nr:hypothetical protein [Streptomyces sp. MNU76]MCC9705477.1 hypothetical protein [Streptomyces sp. MNU76]
MPQDRQAQGRDGLRHHRPDQPAGRQASPQRLTKIIRPQWTVENRLRFVRDHHLREDASKIHTGHGPENTATLRSFAVNQLGTAGHTHIAAGLREMSYQPFTRPLALIGLARPARTHDHSDF